MNSPNTAPLFLSLLSVVLVACPSGAGAEDEFVVIVVEEEERPQPEPEPEVGEPAKLRLATWNIAFLDLPGRSSVSARTEDDYARLKAYGEQLEADVVVVQEVAGRNSVHMVFPRPDWSVECEDRESSQNVCVATRVGVGWRVDVGEDYEELAVGNPRLRRGLDFTISRRGYEPLRVLGLHMKSGCFTGDRGDSCVTFFNQLIALERWIDARAREQVPFAVLGDFNRQLTAQDRAWLELDDAVPSRADLTRSIPQGETTPCWPERYREFIDHVVLDVGAAEWLVDSGQQPYTETGHDTWALRLSDHCPVWADLDVPATR